jgi:murein DD-endopeptidase MepM/ murein hydrolase activator NlpD
LNGDGFEQTGWVVLYQHIATKGRIPVGTWVNAGDRIGHPSCEGGLATGTHVHIARKYNGEWVSAGDPLPFVLSGWTAHAGDHLRQGTLTKGDQTITASSVGSHESQIIRQPGE